MIEQHPASPVRDHAVFTPDETLHFHQGCHARMYRGLGAHRIPKAGTWGVGFGVWAPRAGQVWVMGDFNGWNPSSHPLRPAGNSGVWSGFVPGVEPGALYKYHLQARDSGDRFDKADPCGVRLETPPGTASVVGDLAFPWEDADWMRDRGERHRLDRPLAIYRVHLGSWMRVPEENGRRLTYRELAPKLADYAERHGFTHVGLLPVMERAGGGRWGTGILGGFAPGGDQGTPQDLMFLVDLLHRRGIGVILDGVPTHFEAAPQGLADFDGSPLYERPEAGPGDPPMREGRRFDLSRPEVRSYLLSSALFWLEAYHADGLRIGALGSMLGVDAARGDIGQPRDSQGRRGSPEAVEFLRTLNATIAREYPDVRTHAEESTGWPDVCRPCALGGLGFGLEWNTGFLRDTLGYLEKDPVHRKFHHPQVARRAAGAFAENVVLPLALEALGPGMGSFLARMPGNDAQRFANLRLLLAYTYLQPGKKLVFMGCEFGQWAGWNPESSLDWHLVAEGNRHNGLQKLVGTLNALHRSEPALHERDTEAEGFAWIDAEDAEGSTLTWLRRGRDPRQLLVVACNFTPVPRHNVRVGAPLDGPWHEVLNTDAREFGGDGHGNFGGVEAGPFPWQGQPCVVNLTLPPLAAVAFKPAA